MTQITIDRALVEQALEALEGFAYHGKAAGWAETMTNLRAALAQQAEPVEPDDDLRAVAQAIGFRAVEETK